MGVGTGLGHSPHFDTDTAAITDSYAIGYGNTDFDTQRDSHTITASWGCLTNCFMGHQFEQGIIAGG